MTEPDRPFRYRVPKPNYLPHNIDADGPIVEEYIKPMGQPTDEERAKFFKQCERAAEEYNITRPKGYNVSFHFNAEMEKHHFGKTHPMKPWRLTLAKSLIHSYGMPYAMDMYQARAATYEEMATFHSADYLDFLGTVAPEAQPFDIDNPGIELKYNLGGSDCPLFDGLFDFCSMSCGGSLDAARKIVCEQSDIAITWGGGLHHAKKREASGFCYINDIVVAILQLLRVHPRVLYIDIDVHHGDGVEEAFFSTDRVMTVSFHKYDREYFFPGSGALNDNGPKNEQNSGAHHAINVPLNDGITDEQYKWLFTSVIDECMKRFRPTAIALQCGADSLAGDRLGKFNLQIQGHGFCVEHCKKYNVPMILFGGGGYTPRNVARAWTFETAIAINAHNNIDPTIPLHTPWRENFKYDSTLFPTLEQILGEPRANRNTQKRLNEIIQHVTEQLRFVSHAPSVQMMHIPPDLQGHREEVEARLKEEAEERDENLRQLRESGVGIPDAVSVLQHAFPAASPAFIKNVLGRVDGDVQLAHNALCKVADDPQFAQIVGSASKKAGQHHSGSRSLKPAGLTRKKVDYGHNEEHEKAVNEMMVKGCPPSAEELKAQQKRERRRQNKAKASYDTPSSRNTRRTSQRSTPLSRDSFTSGLGVRRSLRQLQLKARDEEAERDAEGGSEGGSEEESSEEDSEEEDGRAIKAPYRFHNATTGAACSTPRDK